MTVVAELPDNAGLFRSLTAWLARFGTRRGSARSRQGHVVSLWLLVIALATLSTVFLTLDTTAVQP